MSELFDKYVRLINKKDFIIFNLGQEDKSYENWYVCIRTRDGSSMVWDISQGEGKTPGEALKNAYRKLWPLNKGNNSVKVKKAKNKKR